MNLTSRLFSVLALSGLWLAAQQQPTVFPIPQRFKALESDFRVDEHVSILVTQKATPAETSLARQLAAEFSDRYGVALRVQPAATVPPGRFILMGTGANPLIKQYMARHGLPAVPAKAEGYALKVTGNAAVVAGHDEAGAFYGMQSLRQLIRKGGTGVSVRGVEIEDWPHLPFRGIRLYLPGHENIAFFKRFVKDFMALYKFNKVILEVNASMRLDSHPELNAGWLDFVKSLNYTQRYYPQGPRQSYQNSAHQDTADGEIVEKEQVRDLVRYANAHFIEVIPEIPTFTHSYHWLTRHREFAAIIGQEWPDTYCPSDEGIYKMVFAVMNEYIDVMKPKMIHIGHDEMFFPVEYCRCCVKRDPRLLFADDVRRLHAFLTGKGIKVAMYGDHLVESVRGVHRKQSKSRAGWEYHMPGALTPEQVKELIPKDILIGNWFWHDARAAEGRGEPNEIKLEEFGFRQAFANFTPSILNWGRRSARKSVVGGAPSSWAATNEFTFAKDLMIDFLGTSNLMWSTHWPEEESLSRIIQRMMPEVRRRLSGKSLPSEDDNPVEALDLSKAGNAAAVKEPLKQVTGFDLGALRSGAPMVVVGVEGDAPNPLPRSSEAIPVNSDAASIIFIHASARGAGNDMSYRAIHNFADTADLLGWYEVVYEDGFVTSAPVRFGWNILSATWIQKPDVIAKGNAKGFSYAYAAEMIAEGDHSWFAYEWVNPRFGKAIKEIRLRGTSRFVDTRAKPTQNNAIILAGMKIVKKRPIPPASNPEPVGPGR